MKRLPVILSLVAFLVANSLFAQTNTITIAAFNIENWNTIERGKNHQLEPKPLGEREAVVGVITNVRPDVIGMEEMGQTNDLAELVERLKTAGLEYPYRQWLQAKDHDRHVSLL